MGRKTWNDPKMPKPLPGRTNVIFTNNEINMPNVHCLTGDYISNILTIQKIFPTNDVFIIGGPNLLTATKSITEKVYLTSVKGQHTIDVSINLPEYLSSFQLVVWEHGEKCDFSIFQNRGFKTK
jgi:dihydrofolate reductase